MRATTPRYSEEFKSEALALMDRDQRPFRQLLEDLGVSAWTLREAAHAGDVWLVDGGVETINAGYRHPWLGVERFDEHRAPGTLSKSRSTSRRGARR
jgi:hypothetical protein